MSASVLSGFDTPPSPDQAEEIHDLVVLAAELYVAVILDLGTFARRESGLGAVLGHSHAKSVAAIGLLRRHFFGRAREYLSLIGRHISSSARLCSQRGQAKETPPA